MRKHYFICQLGYLVDGLINLLHDYTETHTAWLVCWQNCHQLHIYMCQLLDEYTCLWEQSQDKPDFRWVVIIYAFWCLIGFYFQVSFINWARSYDWEIAMNGLNIYLKMLWCVVCDSLKQLINKSPSELGFFLYMKMYCMVVSNNLLETTYFIS